MSDRIVVFIVLVGMAMAAGVWVGGYQFLFWAFFDPDKPYLPEGSETVIVFITTAMGSAFSLVSLVVTAVVTYKVAQKSMDAGRDAALSVPGAPPVGSQESPEQQQPWSQA